MRAKSRRQTADTATGHTPGTAAAAPAKIPIFSESKDWVTGFSALYKLSSHSELSGTTSKKTMIELDAQMIVLVAEKTCRLRQRALVTKEAG